MDIEEALVAYLKGYSGMSALVGDRIGPEMVSDGAIFPLITYQLISTEFSHTHQGQEKTEAPDYQFTIYATTRASLKTIIDKVKDALCDHHGILSGLNIQYIQLTNEIITSEIMTDGTKVHMADLEFTVNYDRS